MDTVLKVLKVTIKKAKELFLEEVNIVFDQAIYSKALEIIMNPIHEDLRAFCIICTGPFHAIMAFLAVIGLRFSESGLGDLAIESGVIWEGSLKAVLSGKAYNSALRLHKCIYEATVHRKMEAFEEWLRNHGNNEVLTAFTEPTEFQQLLNCPSAESMQQCLDSYGDVANKVYEFEDELRNGAVIVLAKLH